MHNIFRSLSFTIVQNVYTLFPELYEIFTKLASARYFADENIKAMSQNLYIVMCVCMLFALGIRLINAIVNPAALDGGPDGAKKKKSVKSTFINSIFAVLLIVLIPMGFKILYQVQDDVVEKHWIEKVVIGIDTSQSSQNAGQIIAAYTFYSFCQPDTSHDISIEAFSQQGGDIYNKAITEDINYLKQMDSVINSKTNGKYDLEYNAILAPAVGIYIFYQLILVCMDMALRMFKLGLLELITPIILCGFLFQGTELLGNWFKEVIKTYVLVYLKIALMAFMVYGLSLLNGFLRETDKDGNLMFSYTRPDGTRSIFFEGIIRTFIIIGLLQVVKQIPDIINSIFGSNIKPRGGIRGRLGEMAGVGELAQKGWDAVRKKAVGAGLIAATGPVGWAAAGAGLVGGAAVKHGWEKGYGNHGPWKDTTVGRGLRHVGGVGKGIWTGVKSNQGIIGSINEGVKAYKDTEVAKSAEGARYTDKVGKIVSSMKDKFGIGEDGRLTDAHDPTKTKDQRYDAANIAASNLNSTISSTLSSAGAGKYTSDVQKLASASRDKELANAAKSSYSKIDDALTNLINNTQDADLQEKVRNIQAGFRKGDFTANDVTSKLDTIADPSDPTKKPFGEAAKNIDVDVKNLNNLLKETTSSGATLHDVLNKGGNKYLNISDINNETAALETVYNTRKSDIDSKMEKDNASDIQKLVVNKAVEYMDVTHKALADTSKKKVK